MNKSFQFSHFSSVRLFISPRRIWRPCFPFPSLHAAVAHAQQLARILRKEVSSTYKELVRNIEGSRLYKTETLQLLLIKITPQNRCTTSHADLQVELSSLLKLGAWILVLSEDQIKRRPEKKCQTKKNDSWMLVPHIEGISLKKTRL